MDKPMSLTQFANGTHDHTTGGVHSASHHYPMHLTKDSIGLGKTVDDMLDFAISTFTQYVHSDCGNKIDEGMDTAMEANSGGDNIR
jgi:hypothetical protein